MLSEMTEKQLELRLSVVERMVAECRDTKSLPHLNLTYQRLMDELVRRDLKREESQR